MEVKYLKLAITEKPSVARAYADALGVKEVKDGFIDGNGYIISWCVGHLYKVSNAFLIAVRANTENYY